MPSPRLIAAEDIEHAKTLLRYEPSTGVFYWTVTRGRSAKAGDVAGVASDTGHLQIKVSQRVFKAHRLAWAFQFGTHPDGEIDHINGNRRDNRIANLRVVDRLGNASNITTANTKNRTGFLGVRVDSRRNKFQAAIQRQGKFKHLGMFDTPEEAHAAYLAARSAEDSRAPAHITARREAQLAGQSVVHVRPP
jgi:hypothetical protein